MLDVRPDRGGLSVRTMDSIVSRKDLLLHRREPPFEQLNTLIIHCVNQGGAFLNNMINESLQSVPKSARGVGTEPSKQLPHGRTLDPTTSMGRRRVAIPATGVDLVVWPTHA